MLHFEKAGNFKSVSLWYFYNTIDCRQKFGKIIDENKGLYPCHIISMRDMVYCLSHNIDPLSQIGDHYIISREKDYMTTKNNPEMAKVLMDSFTHNKHMALPYRRESRSLLQRAIVGK